MCALTLLSYTTSKNSVFPINNRKVCKTKIALTLLDEKMGNNNNNNNNNNPICKAQECQKTSVAGGKKCKEDPGGCEIVN